MTLSTKLASLAVLLSSLLQTGCGGANSLAPNKSNISLEKETPLATGSKQPGESQTR
jgi:hypothetical protein